MEDWDGVADDSTRDEVRTAEAVAGIGSVQTAAAAVVGIGAGNRLGAKINRRRWVSDR